MIKRGCLDKTILFGLRHVRYVIEQYVEHYLAERPHQEVDNERIDEPDTPPPRDGPVQCRGRLGGVLRS